MLARNDYKKLYGTVQHGTHHGIPTNLLGRSECQMLCNIRHESPNDKIIAIWIFHEFLTVQLFPRRSPSRVGSYAFLKTDTVTYSLKSHSHLPGKSHHGKGQTCSSSEAGHKCCPRAKNIAFHSGKWYYASAALVWNNAVRLLLTDVWRRAPNEPASRHLAFDADYASAPPLQNCGGEAREV